MGKRSEATCNECYFRRAGLCALPGDEPCPTFRSVGRGTLAPPVHAQLVQRPQRPLVVMAATAGA